jgi:hypothetical protein
MKCIQNNAEETTKILLMDSLKQLRKELFLEEL